ncbi:hypothetical protein BFG60_5146 [Microcystis aeruginosa NIES-98]|nr:hypothetical protein BFG60_5146 [Microcystis aeruginosa NIES-98]
MDGPIWLSGLAPARQRKQQIWRKDYAYANHQWQQQRQYDQRPRRHRRL